MTTLGLKNGDLYLDSNGQIGLKTSSWAYSDIIESNVKTLLGEIVFYPEIGIDYEGTIWETLSRKAIWRHYVIEAVTSLPFVSSIKSFTYQFNPTTKVLHYTLIVETDEGSVTVTS